MLSLCSFAIVLPPSPPLYNKTRHLELGGVMLRIIYMYGCVRAAQFKCRVIYYIYKLNHV